MTKPWVRLYRDAILKPKVGRLSLELMGFWAACLMLSDDDGCIPSHEDLAWQLRLDAETVGTLISSLVRNALLFRDVTRSNENRHVFRLHDWDEHQRKSDHDQGGSERQKRFRERQKQAKSDVSQDRNALRNGGVTLSDTDTDTDTEEETTLTTFVLLAPQDEKPKQGGLKKMERKGTRWPDGAIVPNDWVSDGNHARDRAGMKPINLATQAILFQNYWASKSGAQATKIDWKKTWINWCLTAKENGNDNRTTQTTRTGNTFNALLGEYRRNKEGVPEE